MSYNPETLEAFSDALLALHTGATFPESLQAALPCLGRALHSRHIFVDELPHDGRAPRPLGALHPEEMASAAERYPAFAHEHPGVAFVRRGGFAPVLRILDLAPERVFRQTGFFGEIFQPLGIRDQLCLAVKLQRSSIGVTFNRDRPFDDDEARLVALLQPHVAAALQRTHGSGDPVRVSNGYELPVDDHGKPTGVVPLDARRILEEYFGGPIKADRLPADIERWTRHQIARAHPATLLHRPTDTMRIARPRGFLELSVRRTAGSSHPVLVLSEIRGESDFYRLQALGLTRRECEVLFWVTQGKRDHEIGIVAGIATRTVGKHVEHILAKLGTENRAAAAASARAWLRSLVPPSTE